jgi:hypothetical protein
VGSRRVNARKDGRAGLSATAKGCSGEAPPRHSNFYNAAMRSRVLALAVFVALVLGFFLGGSGSAGPIQPAEELVVLSAVPDAAADAGAGHEPADPAHPAESLGQAFAEGAPDLPCLFPTGLEAHCSPGTMAKPRPHAAAAWQHLYLNTPRRPPRTLQVIV